MNDLVTFTSEDFKIYADINVFKSTNTLFKYSRPNEPDAEMYRQRPDIVILEKRRVTIIELTCPFETNFNKSHKFKARRYNNLRNGLITLRAFETNFNKSHKFKARRYNNLRNGLITLRAQLNLILLKISTLGFAGKTIKHSVNFQNNLS